MSANRGFTLIEVMIAMTIAAFVVVAAHQVFGGVADGAKAVEFARESLDRDTNGRRWLKAAFLSLETPFEGRADHASFISWQLTAGGWFEPKQTSLLLSGNRFVVRSGNDTFELRHGVTSVSFDYLLEPGAETKWVSEWVSSVSAPLAVRLRLAGCGRHDVTCADTVLFLIRERG